MRERFSAQTRCDVEALPTPDQLNSLAAVVVDAARKQKLFKEKMSPLKRRKSHFIYIKPLQYTAIDDDQILKSFTEEVRGHIERFPITRHNPHRQWKLLLINTYQQKYTFSDAQFTRTSTLHRFEWSKDQTLHAKRLVIAHPKPDKPTIEDLLDRGIGFSSEEIALDEMEQGMSRVTPEDCNQLREDVVEFCRRSHLIGVDLREMRAS